jgi:hypothetical protein
MNRRTRLASALATLAAASSSAVALAGGTSVSLEFSGSGNTLAATGFENVYMLDGTGFNVTGGNLVMQTLPGDDFGNYENDPDTARNQFFSEIQPLQRTVIEAKVRYENLNVNFHGGGVWMGTDQDHRVRFGLVNNSFKGGVSVEALRENEDLWPAPPPPRPPGPGNDIQGARVPDIAPSPQVDPIDVILRMVRDGTGTGPGGAGGSMFYSLDNGATFNRVGGPGFTFDYVVTGPGQGFNNGATIEGNWKVGVHAFGGPDGQIPATLSYDYFHATSGDTAWAADAAGNWETWNAWTLGVPSAVEATANFPAIITANRTVTITDPAGHNVGSVNLNAGAGLGYTIANTGSLGLRFTRFNGGQALINVGGGNHDITAPVNYASNTTWSVAAGARLRLTGATTFENNSALTKTGAGLVEVNTIQAGGIAVNEGTVRVLADGGSLNTSRVGSIGFGGGQLDLTNNAMVVSYTGTSPIASIRAALLSGYNNGSWNGNGLVSSNGNVNQFGLGYAEASALPSIPPVFGTVVGDAVLIRFTRFGDANLDGTINLQDFNRLAGNFGSANGFWHQGDFNYDGTINLTDFNRLAANFGLSAAGPTVTPQDWARLGAAVPEPSIALLVLAPVLVARRRRAR